MPVHNVKLHSAQGNTAVTMQSPVSGVQVLLERLNPLPPSTLTDFEEQGDGSTSSTGNGES